MWITYKHTNSINGKAYVGFTSKSLDERWCEHVANSKRNSQFAFHRAIAKHGVDVWQHELLEEHSSLEDAANSEIRLIAEHQTFGVRGYNMTEGGEGSRGHVHKHTEEAKRKISEAGRGRVFSEERRRKISEANTGKRRTEEQRKRISEAHKGIVPSEETRKKISAIHLGTHKSEECKRKIGDANRGTVHSEQSRKNMSDAHKGIIPSLETRRKFSLSRMGHKVTEETKQKIRKSHKGKIMSDEARKKMSESAKIRHENVRKNKLLEKEIIDIFERSDGVKWDLIDVWVNDGRKIESILVRQFLGGFGTTSDEIQKTQTMSLTGWRKLDIKDVCSAVLITPDDAKKLIELGVKEEKFC